MGWRAKSKALDLPAIHGVSMNPRKKIKALFTGGFFSLLDWS
jgi:hypothetical protein